jgi:hypothetical protein
MRLPNLEVRTYRAVSSRLPISDNVHREHISCWIRRRTHELVAEQRATPVFCGLSDLEQYVSIIYSDVIFAA